MKYLFKYLQDYFFYQTIFSSNGIKQLIITY